MCGLLTAVVRVEAIDECVQVMVIDRLTQPLRNHHPLPCRLRRPGIGVPPNERGNPDYIVWSRQYHSRATQLSLKKVEMSCATFVRPLL